MGSPKHAKTELLNLSTWMWKTCSQYLDYQQVYSFAAFFYKDKFYVIGGKTKTEVLSAVSTFDPETEKWNQVGELKFPRFGHKIDVFNDKLFVIGGSEVTEYCDITNFSCTMFTDAIFKPENNPTLYPFYTSKCKLGSFKFNDSFKGPNNNLITSFLSFNLSKASLRPHIMDV